jgi:hypothetical protein
MSVEYLMWMVCVIGWCWGVVNAFREGEILGGPGKIMRKTLPEWLSKPLFDCQLCTPSIHGSIWYLYAFGFNNFMMWILFIVSISGFNYVLTKMQYED